MMTQENDSAGEHTAAYQAQFAGFNVVTPEMIAADGGVVRRRNACVECSRRRRKVIYQFTICFSRISETYQLIVRASQRQGCLCLLCDEEHRVRGTHITICL